MDPPNSILHDQDESVLEGLMDLVEDVDLVVDDDDDDDDDDDSAWISLDVTAVEPLLIHEDEEMKQAFARVPDFEKREYLQALEEAPELVKKESRWDDFMWAEDNKAYRAALRLARYWKARRFAFGEERWLRPLNQTGKGALNEHDIELLRTGYMVNLHRPSGGVVTLVDYSRLPRNSPESQLRLLFYHAQINPKICQGCVAIFIESGAPTPPISLSTNNAAVGRVAFPWKVKELKIYVVQALFEPGREALVDYNTYQQQQTIRYTSQHFAERVLGNSMRQTFQMLQQVSGGIEQECLPRCIGGTYDYGILDEWMRRRLSVEFEQMSVLVTSPPVNCFISKHPSGGDVAMLSSESQPEGSENENDMSPCNTDLVLNQQSHKITSHSNPRHRSMTTPKTFMAFQWIDYRSHLPQNSQFKPLATYTH